MESKALKSGTWYTISSILLKAVSIITAPIFTRLLSTADYGKTSNFMAWLNILTIFTGLCLSYCIGIGKIEYQAKFPAFLSSIQSLGTCSWFLIGIILVIFSEPISDFMHIEQTLIWVMAGYALIVPSVEYMQCSYRYEYKYKQNIFISIFNTVGVVIFSLLFIWIFQTKRHYGRILGTLFPMFLIGSYCYSSILFHGKKFFDAAYWKFACKICIPMIPHAVAMVILNQIDRIMILKFCGDSAAGIYSFAYNYAILLQIFSNAIAQAWTPWLYEQYAKQERKAICTVNNQINFLMCAITTLFIAIAPEILMVLGEKSYWSGKWVVTPIALGTLCQYFYNNYSSIEIYHKKTIFIAIGSVGAAFVNIILNALFIPKYGYQAAAYTTLVGYFLLMVFHSLGCRWAAKKNIFSNIKIYVGILITGLASICCVLLYERIWLRYGLLAGVTILLGILKRHEILILMKQLSSKKS